MKTINFLLILTISTLLAGCSSSGTIHPSQLAKAALLNETHCYSEEFEIIENRLNEFLKTCFFSSRFNSNAIKIGNIAKGKRISLTTGTNYQFSVELRQNVKGCTTQAIMYGIDKDWTETIYQSNLAVIARDYTCP